MEEEVKTANVNPSSTSCNYQQTSDKLTLLHSVGYECQRYFNLCVADEHSLVFCSGCLLHIFNTSNGKVHTRPSDAALGLGFVTKNPVDSHIAVGEKGPKPSVVIYSWPNFDIITKLRNGTTKSYVFLTYSQDGHMLCAQGGAPDHSLSLWDWRAGVVVARATSPYTLSVHFSSFSHNYIVSCGEEGITFWQLTKTHTGLKLLKERGNFNILEECQVLAVQVMPDGKVVSGCSWGNILLWAEGRVEVEACLRNGEACHKSPIINFIYNQQIDEICTVGMDGWIKMWNYSRFKAGPISEDMKVVIKPVFEIQVCDDRGPAVLSYILKKNNDPLDTTWFAQDRNGGIWQVDVQVSARVAPAVRLYSCHAGPVMSVAASPHSLQFASLAANGVLNIYDLVSGQLLALKEFPVGGTKLLWLPVQKISGEDVIAAGFADGSLKALMVTSDGTGITVMQESKPHTAAVTAVSVNQANDVLVSGGEDCTVFVYRLQDTGQLSPLGYWQLTGPARCLTWTPGKVDTLVVCCKTSLNEVDIPKDAFTGASYKLSASTTETKLAYSGGGNIAENLLFATYLDESIMFIADRNMIFEYKWGTKSISNEMLSDLNIKTVNMMQDKNTWFLGLENGTLRTMIMKEPTKWLAEGSWHDLTLHDTDSGGISDICVSYNGQYVVSCGLDGNVFIYLLNLTSQQATTLAQRIIYKDAIPEEEEDSQEEPGMSLEEAKKESVLREKLAVSMMKKVRAQRQLISLRSRYSNLLARNIRLPESQKLPRSSFVLDKRLQNHIKNLINQEMLIVKQKLNFDVEKSQLHLHKIKRFFVDCLAAFHIEISSLRGKKSVATFVHRKLEQDFEEGEAIVKSLVQKVSEKTRINGVELTQKPLQEKTLSVTLDVDPEESYMRSVQDIYNQLSIKTKRALEKHRLIKKRKEERRKQWLAFTATQPDQEKNLTSDIASIDHAMRTIGDYKLKQSDEFKLSDQFKNTSLYKLSQLVEAKREIFNTKEGFNKKIYSLRSQKVELVKKMWSLENKLMKLHKELPEESRIQPPLLPQLNLVKEFPERQYQICPEKEPVMNASTEEDFDEELLLLYGQGVSNSSCNSTQSNDSKHSEDVEEDTLWESQIGLLRTTKQIFKQGQIIEEMESLLTLFDQQVEDLSQEKMQLSIDINYLENFVNVLNQELHIVHSYDETEAAILERVNYSLAEKHTKHLKMNILQHKIDNRVAEMILLEENLAALEKSFSELTAANRVVKHLKRIFNKKYRPQLLTKDNEEGSEDDSSDEETSEDSDSTIHVGKPSPRSDDHKCPSDCDKDIHKETLELRTKRHQIEAKITTEKLAIDQMTREKERNYKLLKLIEPVLRMNQDQLEKIQKEKQMKLNETEVLVVLNCSQICGQNLLMSKQELDKLRSRVSELQKQTEKQQEKLRKNERYQQRLGDECLKMEIMISQLNKDIDKAMVGKFGQHVDLEIMEEKILELMIRRTRQSLKEEELHKKYEKIIKNLKEELLEKTEDLADLMRINTHKLQMLSSLEEEKQKLISLSIKVNKAAAESSEKDFEYTEDVRKLTRILQNLILQKETIIHEIKVLSLKGRPLPPIAAQSGEEPTKSTTVQSNSRDSDDAASSECRVGARGERTDRVDSAQQAPEPEGGVEQESEGSDFNHDYDVESLYDSPGA